MARVHHSAICTSDVETSLRFWRDGLGFEQLMDHHFDGDWPHLFGAPSTRLRSIFLGDADSADAGVVELVVFEDPGSMPTTPPPSPDAAAPAVGFLLLSLYADIDATLDRLAEMGLGGQPRVTSVGPDVRMAVVRDPNGVTVELIGGAAQQNLTRLTNRPR